MLGGIYSRQSSPTKRNVSVSTLPVSTINRRVSNYVCCVQRSTLTNIPEFCQIRENNYANSFPAERDQIFNPDDFRFYVRANSHGSYNLLAGSFQKSFSSLVYTNQRFWKIYGNATRTRVIICRAKAIRNSFSRFVSHHGYVSRLPNAVQLKRVIAVW